MLGDCPTIHIGGTHELFRRVIQQIRLGGLSNEFYRNSVVSFREQKAFVLKTVFLLAFGLGMCEGVGEDSRHGNGHGPQSRTHKNRAPLGPFTTMNHFWFHLSPNHCDTKTHNKTIRHQSQDKKKSQHSLEPV